MISQPRAFQPVHVLLFSLGFMLILLGGNSVTILSIQTNKTVTESSITPDPNTQTSKVSIKDPIGPSKGSSPTKSDKASTYTPSPKISIKDPFGPSKGSPPTSDKASTYTPSPKKSSVDETITSHVPTEHGERPGTNTTDRQNIDSTTSKISTTENKSTPENTGVVICIFVFLFIIIIIGSLYFILKKRKKMSYSLTYSKTLESSNIPLSKVKD